MEYLSKEAGIIYEFNRQHEPIKKVHSGTTLQIETYDCFTNQIRSEDTPVARIDWNRVNPATGPIYVEGAMPGDVLKVKIEQIELANQGVMVVGPQLGVMGQHITEMQSKIISVENGHALFDDVRIPLNPMIGVIGVAPEGDGINCGTPGSHGGNMDNKMVAEVQHCIFQYLQKVHYLD
ncbi:acetamidase/formamidase family protein [Bacillus sp. JCM 19034]|uniref:acetamidase/formamidase family protein n=1 Tax=Bacillus sp. JCM 19034 TaxID=1481928 RepID=UPI000B240681